MRRASGRRAASAVLVGLLLLLLPGAGSDVQYMDAVCPLYGHKFTAQLLVQGESSIAAYDADLCKRPVGLPSPYIYAVWTCPHCFFSSYQADFTGTLGPEFRDMALLTTRLDPSRATQDAIEPGIKFANAETFYRTSGRDARFLADLALRGSYACRVTRLRETAEYRDLGRKLVDELLGGKPRRSVELVSRQLAGLVRRKLDGAQMSKEEAEVYRYFLADSLRQAGEHLEAEIIYRELLAAGLLPDRYLANARRKADLCRQEGTFQEKALAYFQQALDEGLVPEEEKTLVIYLRAEISRRVGSFSEARKLFAEAASLPADPPWIGALIEAQTALLPPLAPPAESAPR